LRAQLLRVAAMLKNKISYLVLRLALFYLVKRNPEAAKRLSNIDGKVFEVVLEDQGSRYFILIKGNRFKMISRSPASDGKISGKTDAFIGLIRKRYDPDELFFKRQLTIEGDIGLVTYLKNTLAHL